MRETGLNASKRVRDGSGCFPNAVRVFSIADGDVIRRGEVGGHSPSEAPSSAAAGGEVRRSCLSPQGEFCAGRLTGAAQGSHSRSE